MIEANQGHIIEELVANFIADLPAEEVYHAAQTRGFTWGAVCALPGRTRRRKGVLVRRWEQPAAGCGQQERKEVCYAGRHQDGQDS